MLVALEELKHFPFSYLNVTYPSSFFSGDISPGQRVSVKLSFSPVRTGMRKLLVDFDSDRLKDVKGATTVVVHKKKRNTFPIIPGYY